MKKGDLVRFNKAIVSELLADDTDNWQDWVGVIIQIQDEDFCKVAWHDGIIRQEFIEQLEVVSKINKGENMFEFIMSFFKADPGKKILKERDALYEKSVILQRSGDLREYGKVMKRIEDLENQYDELQSGDNK